MSARLMEDFISHTISWLSLTVRSSSTDTNSNFHSSDQPIDRRLVFPSFAVLLFPFLILLSPQGSLFLPINPLLLPSRLLGLPALIFLFPLSRLLLAIALKVCQQLLEASLRLRFVRELSALDARPTLEPQDRPGICGNSRRIRALISSNSMPNPQTVMEFTPL
jgi:hypothetical protein